MSAESEKPRKPSARELKLASGIYQVCTIAGCQSLNYGDLPYCYRHRLRDPETRAAARYWEARLGKRGKR